MRIVTVAAIAAIALTAAACNKKADETANNTMDNAAAATDMNATAANTTTDMNATAANTTTNAAANTTTNTATNAQ